MQNLSYLIDHILKPKLPAKHVLVEILSRVHTQLEANFTSIRAKTNFEK